jgi:predicted nuclease of predicted toxin-antitoxin system
VKLLFDENLSPKLVALLASEFPSSTHVELLKMRGATDRNIWRYARDHDLIVVSKDNDFRQQVFYTGHHPKSSGYR